MELILEYIWFGRKGELHSKTRVIPVKSQLKIEEIPIWRCNEYPGFVLKPIRLLADPFRSDNEHVILCEMLQNSDPVGDCKELFDSIHLDDKPCFGLEQAYSNMYE
jgi:hypothetical protein